MQSRQLTRIHFPHVDRVSVISVPMIFSASFFVMMDLRMIGYGLVSCG